MCFIGCVVYEKTINVLQMIDTSLSLQLDKWFENQQGANLW